MFKFILLATGLVVSSAQAEDIDGMTRVFAVLSQYEEVCGGHINDKGISLQGDIVTKLVIAAKSMGGAERRITT